MLISTFIKNQSIINLKSFVTKREIRSFLEILIYLAIILLGLVVLSVGIKKLKTVSLITICLLYFFILIKFLTMTDSADYPEKLQNFIANINDWSISHPIIFWMITGVTPLLIFFYFALFRKKGISVLLSFLVIFSFLNFDAITYLFPGLKGSTIIILILIGTCLLVLVALFFFLGSVMFLIAFSVIGSFFASFGLVAFSLDLINTLDKNIYAKCINSRILDFIVFGFYFCMLVLSFYLQISFRKNV
ncbi:hypothetical protein TUBRATIS_21200 [Tubulinosema ratisbonensis]|uniref:Uncharacterized protein n=1 Tax=Tubulinosema ratisbonensis TaxID=291195 RepID=A0A437AJS5_9MICR|nr:hypothetical protein TUBRATIS_21200 [Tubulinosema ratisbonensis]